MTPTLSNSMIEDLDGVFGRSGAFASTSWLIRISGFPTSALVAVTSGRHVNEGDSPSGGFRLLRWID